MADLARNRKAFHDYEVTETIEAGIALVGTEVKSCRGHNVNLGDGYATVEEGEVMLHHVHISPYDKAHRDNHDPMRPRRLLLHKSEIRKLVAATRQKGMTLIPLAVYLKGPRIKVALGVCRGKSHADKRETLKRKDDERQMRQAVRRKG